MNKIVSLFALVFALSGSYISAQENSIELKVKEANYKVGTSNIYITLEFKNNSRDTMYLIKPQNHFFNKHYDFDVTDYPQLSNYPYLISINPNNQCTDEEVARIVSNLVGSKQLEQEEIFVLLPNETKVFNAIEIEYEDIQFCSTGKYTVSIFYKPEIHPDAIQEEINEKGILHQINIQRLIQSKITKCVAIK